MGKGNKHNKNKGKQEGDEEQKHDSEPTTMDNTTAGDITTLGGDDSMTQDPQLTAEQLKEPHNHFGTDMGSYKEPEVHDIIHEEPAIVEKKKEETVDLEIIETETPKDNDQAQPTFEDAKEPKSDKKPQTHETSAKDSDNASSFVKIGDSLAPHHDDETKDIQTLTPPAHTPKDLAGHQSKEPHVPENTPIVLSGNPSTNPAPQKTEPAEPERKSSQDKSQTGGVTLNSTHIDTKKVDTLHSPIPDPPIPNPPIPQPPAHVDLGNDKELPKHETAAKLITDKDAGKVPAGDNDGNSALFWGIGIAAVGVAVVVALKWKKVL